MSEQERNKAQSGENPEPRGERESPEEHEARLEREHRQHPFAGAADARTKDDERIRAPHDELGVPSTGTLPDDARKD